MHFFVHAIRITSDARLSLGVQIYYRIAVALIERQITVHEALLYQSEAKAGLHTASSGLFLRDFPGRLVLYPFLAATCAVIFFDGKWIDAGVAAICGVASGLIDYALSYTGGQAKVLTDVTVGVTVGVIGGLWYDHVKHICLSGIFLGALYWFFYGTAFVIGLLEIIAGELETGVTRFVGVSVKTFVLSLGAAIGLMISHGGGARDVWLESEAFCDKDFVKGQVRQEHFGFCSPPFAHSHIQLICSLMLSVVENSTLPPVFRCRPRPVPTPDRSIHSGSDNSARCLRGSVFRR